MPPRVQGVQGAGPGPQEAFMALPPVTRYWLASSLLATAACSFGYLSAWSLALDWVGIVQRFEVWRLFTPFIFFGTFDFNFAITMFRMYQYSRMYEVNPFNSGGGGSSADYMYVTAPPPPLLLLVLVLRRLPATPPPPTPAPLLRRFYY